MMDSVKSLDMIHFHMNRIASSVLRGKSIALFLCNTDLQDVTKWHLTQAGKYVEDCPEVRELLPFTEGELSRFLRLAHCTAFEADDFDAVELWNYLQYIMSRFLA